MTILDKVREAFSQYKIGTVFTRSEIIDKMKTNYGVNKDSVIPSDYCYNRTNKDKETRPTLRDFNIFEWMDNGNYRYLGEDYDYKGPIIKNPKK